MCNEAAARVEMTENKVIYICLMLVNEVLNKISSNEAFCPFANFQPHGKEGVCSVRVWALGKLQITFQTSSNWPK